MSIRGAPVEELIRRAIAGDRRSTGRLLSLVEAGGTEAERVTELTPSPTGGAHIVGITGPPGSGKSTLVARLIGVASGAAPRPAVLAVDPSSPLTGGAILGDRVRMTGVDSGAFIRSMATRGHIGGLALAIPGAVRVLEAAGFDPVMIETVGVGQVEVDITAAADTTVVVVTPGMGDAVQASKAGLLEVADVFVVNKADRPGATGTRRDLELMLELSHVTGHEDADYRPPILMTNSLDGQGVVEVCEAIIDHRTYLESSGKLAERRHRRARFEVANRLQGRFDRSLADLLDSDPVRILLDQVAAGTVSPAAAARRLAQHLVPSEARAAGPQFS